MVCADRKCPKCGWCVDRDCVGGRASWAGPMVPCYNTCSQFKAHSGFPGSGVCKAATDPDPIMRVVFHSNKAMLFHYRRQHARDIVNQEALF